MRRWQKNKQVITPLAFKKQNQLGFTLMEVLLAMTLLSIMVVLLFSSLNIAAESWNRGEKKIAAVNEKAVVYQFFKRHLPSIQPLWDDFSDKEANFSFQGQHNALQFVSVFPASAGRKGLQLFNVVLQTGKKSIEVSVKPFYPEMDGQQWQQEQVTLIDNVKTLDISYFIADKKDSGGAWQHDWQDKEFLPELIKIKITLLDESDWPEMIFSLQLSSQSFENDSDDEE